MSTEKEDIKALQAKAAELVKARKASIAPTVEGRREAAEKAILNAIIAAEGDTERIIVHRLPEEHGGVCVSRVPSENYWNAYQRRLIAAEKKGNMPEVVAGLVENRELLIHPAASELQRWVDDYPGLYTSIANTIGNRCEGSDPGKASPV